MATFAWLDFSETDRQRALDVIDAFREKGTVDELGIGTIRDAIADLLFPGTSTIMTRARYYLFVPWVYLGHESKKTKSSELAQLAKRDELRLIKALKEGGESLGVIGIEAGDALKRLPSTVYWQALGTLGIRRYSKSRDHYHRGFDAITERKATPIRGDDKQLVVGGLQHSWHPSIPPAPAGFPRTETTLELSEFEAEFLRDRVLQAAPHSLFAWLVNNDYDDTDFDFPWEHPQQENFSARNRAELRHARNFAEVMHGAALLYNLLIARKNEDEENTGLYEGLFDEWAEEMESRTGELQAWNREDFWTMVTDTGRRIPQATQTFARLWFDKALAPKPASLATSKTAETFIAAREKALKGSLSRLDGAQSRNWGGASSSGRLDFRWKRPVRAIVADIRAALD